MSLPILFLLALSITAAIGQQICQNNQLGLSLQFCQPCGSPGLDDFCIKRYGRCGTYSYASGNTYYGTLGGGSGLPPHGYLSSGNPPATCNYLIETAARIPNRVGGTGTIPVYLQVGDWGRSLPRVSFNSEVSRILNVLYPLSNCLENNAPFPNGYWNYANPYVGAKSGWRLDSFEYMDINNGNATWSYQCYCDFCNSCQQCTNG